MALADKWRNAWSYEIDTLAKNGAWTVDLPAGQKAAKSNRIYKADEHFPACFGSTEIHAHSLIKLQRNLFPKEPKLSPCDSCLH